MNAERSSQDGFWWHVATNPENGLNGVYLRLGQQKGVILPRDEALSLLTGLERVLHGTE